MAESLNLPSLSLTEAQLEIVHARVAEGPNDTYYPGPEYRLHADTPGVEFYPNHRRIVVPYEVNGQPAPWHVQNHPNRTRALADPKLAPLLDSEILSTSSEPLPPVISKRYFDQGYWLDQNGNPVPYAAVQMLNDPQIGALTGMGSYWHKGINQSSDLVLAVRSTPIDSWSLLIVERKDATNHDGTLAFPGGHNDRGEAGANTARRETSEETGIPQAALGNPNQYEQLNAGLLIGAGATVHAMSGNEAFIHIVEGAAAESLLALELRASSESYSVGWRTLGELATARSTGRFFPHHFGHLALVEAKLA